MTDQADEDALLAAMLEQAERLCRTPDSLMAGQYRHLCDRIRALIEVRACMRSGEPSP